MSTWTAGEQSLQNVMLQVPSRNTKEVVSLAGETESGAQERDQGEISSEGRERQCDWERKRMFFAQ